MLTLGLESSCDETAVALVADGTHILANVISSQIEIHRRFGGVVPEVAARKHLEAFLPVLEEALATAGLSSPATIDQIAFSAGPGLLGPLLVGLGVAKALAWGLRKPLIPVHHLEAHLAGAFLGAQRLPEWPAVGLIVSGGHCTLVHATGPRSYRILGETADDAPGELFDKLARFLELGYPGGPVIQEMGRNGDAERYRLPRPMLGKGFGFSFSGLKTAVIRLAEAEGRQLRLADLCASLQAAVSETIMNKVAAALDETNAPRLIMAGGVAANTVLRDAIGSLARARQVELLLPPLSLCTDNAAMVAAQGFHSAALWPADTSTVNAVARWPMGAPFMVMIG